MKNVIRVSAMMGVLALAAFGSCQKYSNNSNVVGLPADTSEARLNQLFSGLRPGAQVYSVTAGAFSTIIGTKGTVLNFYPNSFKDASGHILTSGTVNVQLIEMTTAGDMIRNRTSSTAGGTLLQSGGQITISATMGGQSVFANTYGIAYKQNAVSSQSMQLFYGTISPVDSVTKWNIADTAGNGKTAAGTGIPTQAVTDTSGTYFNSVGSSACYFIFDSCTTFQSINCDHFLGNGPGDSTVTVIATMPDTSFNKLNTTMYCVFPTINCVMSGDFGWTGTSVKAAINIPKGLAYKFVAITNKAGNYYFYQTSGTITSGMNIHTPMAPDTRDGVIAKLDAL